MVVLDPEGRIVRPNEAFVAATGYPFEALRGMSIWDLLPGEDLESCKRAFVELRSGGILCYRHASCLAHRDGSRRKVEWATAYLLDSVRQAEFFVVTGVDITEKQRAADESRERAEELAELHRRYMASGLGGVEIQYSDPATAATLWSRILNRPAATSGGAHRIAIDGGEIRFVPITDGRGPGVSAFDVKAADRERVLAAAEKRGKRRSDSQVEVCGCRINLV